MYRQPEQLSLTDADSNWSGKSQYGDKNTFYEDFKCKLRAANRGNTLKSFTTNFLVLGKFNE